MLSYPVAILTSFSDKSFLLPFSFSSGCFSVLPTLFHFLVAVNGIKKEMTGNVIYFVHESVSLLMCVCGLSVI